MTPWPRLLSAYLDALAFARGVKREQVLHLAQLDFLAEHKNVVFLAGFNRREPSRIEAVVTAPLRVGERALLDATASGRSSTPPRPQPDDSLRRRAIAS